MDMPQVVTADEWQQARDALLVKEKELTRALDALAAERRRLPMVRFGTDYDAMDRLGSLFEEDG